MYVETDGRQDRTTKHTNHTKAGRNATSGRKADVSEGAIHLQTPHSPHLPTAPCPLPTGFSLSLSMRLCARLEIPTSIIRVIRVIRGQNELVFINLCES